MFGQELSLDGLALKGARGATSGWLRVAACIMMSAAILQAKPALQDVSARGLEHVAAFDDGAHGLPTRASSRLVLGTASRQVIPSAQSA
jgi:hypothetical protein